MADQCSHLGQVDAEAEPSSPGCEDCLRDGSRWVHLRMCRVCGHVGCCDSSPNKHATAHFDATGHPLDVVVRAGRGLVVVLRRRPRVPRP